MTTRTQHVLDISFLQSRGAIRRIAILTAGFAVIGFLGALVAPRWYRSTLTLVPNTPPRNSGLSSLMGGELGGLAAGLGASVGGADIARIGAVLQSTAVTDAVIDKFDLKGRYGARYQEGARAALWKHCDVKPMLKPNLVQLSCEDKDPQFVQGLLAYFADHGNQVFRRVNVSSASEEVRFLERRVVELRQQADDAARKVREFQEQHQIVELDAQAKALVSAMATLNAQRIAKQMELGWARAFSSRDEAGSRQLESQLGVVEETIRDLEEIPSTPAPSARGAKGRARDGSGPFPPASVVPRLRAEYEALYRDRKVAEATLVFSLDRLETARATEARDVSTFQVLDPPTLPTRPARPRTIEWVAFAAMAGLSAAIGLEWWRARRLASQGSAPPDP